MLGLLLACSLEVSAAAAQPAPDAEAVLKEADAHARNFYREAREPGTADSYQIDQMDAGACILRQDLARHYGPPAAAPKSEAAAFYRVRRPHGIVMGFAFPAGGQNGTCATSLEVMTTEPRRLIRSHGRNVSVPAKP